MAGKTGSAGDKARYTRYKAENRYEKNKRAKFERHQKRHPNDTTAKPAAKFSKKAPAARTHFYSRSVKDFAHTLRLVAGSAKGLEAILKLEHTVYA